MLSVFDFSVSLPFGVFVIQYHDRTFFADENYLSVLDFWKFHRLCQMQLPTCLWSKESHSELKFSLWIQNSTLDNEDVHVHHFPRFPQSDRGFLSDLTANAIQSNEVNLWDFNPWKWSSKLSHSNAGSNVQWWNEIEMKERQNGGTRQLFDSITDHPDN
jgi:hypothetical protein